MRGRRGPELVVLGAILVLTGLHVVWLARFRFGYVTEWDESGYIAIALRNTHSLTSSGPFSLASTVLDQGIQAPLVPLTAVIPNLFGAGVDASLLVEPVFFAVLVLTTYAIARRLTTYSWALIAALVAATAPVVADYTRIFHFAVPAAAMMSAALWALMKSEGLKNRRWSLACGLLLGLMVLTRSMTLAYLPGFAIAAALPILLEGEQRQRLVNAAILAAGGALLAAIWYFPNRWSVGSYLLNFGYGAESAEYGAHHSPISIAFWTREAGTVLDELYLPLFAALALSAVLALGSALFDKGRTKWSSDGIKAWLTSDTALALVIVVEGYVALTSSKNEGTAFGLPWLPILIVLVCAAAGTIRQRPLRVGAAALLVAVAAFNLAMKEDVVRGISEPRTADLGLLGTAKVADGVGLVEEEVAAAGYPTGPPTQPMPDLQKRWLPFDGEMADWMWSLADRKGVEPRVAWGVEDLILNNTRLALGSELSTSRPLYNELLKPYIAGDSAGAYREQIERAEANLVVTGNPEAGITGVHLTRERVEAAARSLGLHRARVFSAPDGRELTVWAAADLP